MTESQRPTSETRAFLADGEAQALARARAYERASAGALTFRGSEWDERTGRLTAHYDRATAAAAPVWVPGGPDSSPGAGWVAGPPVLSQRRRAPFVVAGLAIALAVVAAGLGGLGLLDDTGTSRPVDRAALPSADPVETTPAGATLPLLQDAECRFAAPSWLSVRCHDLLVPQDRSDPAGGVVRLHIGVFATDVAEPAADPVVFLAGGPGGRALFDREDFSLFPFLAHRDLIVIDQRGTGHSRPSLDCPEVDRVPGNTFGGRARQLLALRECRARLVADGVVLDAYSSAESAADLADLRQALGIEAWNLYGASYGTRLALTAMRDHPEGIRSVILDAAYPPQVDLYADGARNAARAFDLLFRACEESPACRSAHPRLRDVFYDEVEMLDERPLRLASRDGGTWHVDGQVLIEFLFDRLYLTHVIPSLPATLDDIAAGRRDALLAYLEEDELLPEVAVDPEDLSDGMHFSVQCQEEVPFTDRSAYLEASRGLPSELVDAFDPAVAIDACDAWRVTPRGPIEDEPVTSDIPTLVMVGEFDPITPPEWGAVTVSSLADAHFFPIAGAGHGVVAENDCARAIAESFLEEPTRRPDTGCLASLERPPFEP
jgi:pimeloyl-ACP methyl ester carboxylesterase